MSTAQCDFLLTVATDVEREALLAVAERNGMSSTPVEGKYSVYEDLGAIGEGRVMCMQTEVGAVGFGAAATKLLLAKTETRATSVIAIGMAFGVSPETQKAGDVLISTHLIPYDRCTIDSDAGIPRLNFGRTVSFPAKESLQKLIWRRTEDSQQPVGFHVSLGALLTGQAFIQCGAYREHLRQKLSKLGEQVIGGEMEGVGLVGLSPKEFPSWIVVKGVSDFADEARRSAPKSQVKDAQRLACENAATLVLGALAASASQPRSEEN